MTNKQKGDKYEQYIKDFLLQNPDNSKVKIWHEIPCEYLQESGIIKCYNDKLVLNRMKKDNEKENGLADIGCDILYFNKENKWKIVQAKDHKSVITIEKLAGFFSIMNTVSLKGEVYYTSKLSKNITRLNYKNIDFVYKPYENIKKEIINETKFVPRDYQIEAYNEIMKNNRGILQLPCGLGKTNISIMCADDFECIILFSPLKLFAQQLLIRFSQSLDKYNCYLIDSEGDRNVENIKKKLKNKVILSCTYKSADVIFSLIDEINKSYTKIFVIVDEFHNLSRDNVTNKNNDFYKVLSQKNWKYLFLSATPKIYDVKNNNLIKIKEENENNNIIENNVNDNVVEDIDDDVIEDIDDNNIIENYAVDSDDEQEKEQMNDIIGKVIYKKEFRDSIKEGYICDIDIYVTKISIKEENYLKEITEKEKIKIIDKNVDVKSSCLLRCIDDLGHNKTIGFCNSIDECKKFKESIERINQYFNLDLKTGIITSENNLKERDEILKDFVDFKGKGIIFSIRILDECVDIISCDSVFFANKCDNKTRIIQRICRAIRKDPKNINKRAGIFLCCNEYDEMTDIIASLKELDYEFNVDKVKIVNCYDENNKIIVKRCENGAENDENYKDIDKFVISVKRVLTWDEKYELLKEFIEKNNLSPSNHSKVSEEKKLARWCYIQRCRYKEKNISDEQIKKMESIKFWYWDDNDIFNKKYDELIEFINCNNKLPSSYTKLNEEKTLALWSIRQRSKYKENKLSEEQIKKMESIKFWYWDDSDIFNKKYDELIKFINCNNKLPSATSKDKKENNLGNWCISLRKNKVNLSEENTSKLNDIKLWWWNEDDYFDKKYDEIKIWISVNKKFPLPHSKDIIEKELGQWADAKKEKHKNNNLDKKYIEKCETIPLWQWRIKRENKIKSFENMYEELKDFVNKNNKMPTESKNSNIEEIKLAQWCTKIKNAIKHNKISQEKIDLLNKINLWDIGDVEIRKIKVFEDEYEKLTIFIKNNNRLPNTTSNDERELYKWCERQKIKNRRNILSENEIKLLNELPFWSWGLEDKFNEDFKNLLVWIETNKKLPVSSSINKDENKLAKFCFRERNKFKNNKLSSEKINILNSIKNWSWNVMDDLFNDSYNELCVWVNINKRIPSGVSKDDMERKLGIWASHRRQDNKKNKLSEEKIEILNKIPYWYW